MAETKQRIPPERDDDKHFYRHCVQLAHEARGTLAAQG